MAIRQQSGAYFGCSFPVMFRELSESAGSECLGSMTPETQDIYLRMDHHRRRSGYRLGRIIARQQLLKRIAGGRSHLWREVTVALVVGYHFFFFFFQVLADKPAVTWSV